MKVNSFFEREMTHNYLVIQEENFFQENINEFGDYKLQMILNNKIQGLLPVTRRIRYGNEQFCYEISGMQTLANIYEHRLMKACELRELILGCICVYQNLEDYLLEPSQIILHPEYIFIDLVQQELAFTYYPKQEMDSKEQFRRLIDYVLTKIDHQDPEAVMLGYEIYQYTRNLNFVLSEIENLLYRTPAKNQIYYNEEDGSEQTKLLEEVKQPEEEYDFFEEQEIIYEEPDEESKKIEKMKKRGMTGSLFIAGIFLLFLLGGRFTSWYHLSSQQTMYGIAVIAMSCVAALYFQKMKVQESSYEESFR